MPLMALRSDAPIQPRAVTARETRDLSSIRSTLRNAKAVLFDVDSTLSPDEGIDELAGWLGKKAEVEALTSKAMNGDLAFEDAMRQRLHVRRSPMVAPFFESTESARCHFSCWKHYSILNLNAPLPPVSNACRL